jgi:uncharacterized membrane protein
MVVLAEFNSTSYKVFLLLHVLGAIVAFGAAFVNPFVYRFAARRGDGASVAAAQANAGMRVSLPAIVFTGFIGFGLAGLSELPGTDILQWEMSQGWLLAAAIIWVAQALVYALAVVPAQRRVAGGDQSADKRVAAFGGLIHISLLVMLWLMIFKPGT